MSSKNTTKANGVKVAKNQNSKTGNGKSIDKALDNNELLSKNEVSDNDSKVPTAETKSNTVLDGTETVTKTVEGTESKSQLKKEKSAAAKTKTKSEPQKKAVSNGKSTVVKKIKLAASTYHYYRNWLAEFMRSHGVPSAKFQKSPESYNGHITVLETEKAKGLKALEQWNKQNPDTKELFWDVKK
jgi:flagellar biosynthesis chaperone FliJ